MRIRFSELTDLELSRLIALAMGEWTLRHSWGAQRPAESRPLIKRDLVVNEPASEDKEFALYVKGLLADGEYIKASERLRVSEIAERHPDWVRRQGLPASKGTAAWRDAARMASRRAEEQ